jgi:hypothetical protein
MLRLRRILLVATHVVLGVVCARLWWQAEALDAGLEQLARPVHARQWSNRRDEVVALMRVINRYGRTYEPGWSCGNYAVGLGRMLQLSGYEVRLVQILARGVWGAHIAVETRLDDRWVLLDPLFGLAFHRPDGTLANAADLQRDWTSYVSQTPPGYDRTIRYEGIRYTDWELGPMSLLRPVASAVFGKEATKTFSLRSLALNRYRALALAVSGLWGGLGLVTLPFWRGRRTAPAAC